jgi:hypothetical protein
MRILKCKCCGEEKQVYEYTEQIVGYCVDCVNSVPSHINVYQLRKYLLFLSEKNEN